MRGHRNDSDKAPDFGLFLVGGRDDTLCSHYFFTRHRNPGGAQKRGLYFYLKKKRMVLWIEGDVKDGFTEKAALSLN